MQSSVEPISFVANLGQFSWKLSLLTRVTEKLQTGLSPVCVPPALPQGSSVKARMHPGVWNGISHSVVSDSFATPRTVARQAPLSMGFSRQEYWSGLPFPSPEDIYALATSKSSSKLHYPHPATFQDNALTRNYLSNLCPLTTLSVLPMPLQDSGKLQEG